MTVVNISHPSELAALMRFREFIQVYANGTLVWKCFGSPKTTVKYAVSQDCKERTGDAYENDQAAVSCQCNSVLIRPKGIWSQGTQKSTQDATTACIMDHRMQHDFIISDNRPRCYFGANHCLTACPFWGRLQDGAKYYCRHLSQTSRPKRAQRTTAKSPFRRMLQNA